MCIYIYILIKYLYEMTENILKKTLNLIANQYNIPQQHNNSLYNFRKAFYDRQNNIDNKSNNRYCFICHKFQLNLKLRQINNFTRVTDEIISTQLVCENCSCRNLKHL